MMGLTIAPGPPPIVTLQRAARRTASEILLARQAFVTVGKGKRQTRIVNPELRRLFEGAVGMARARAVLAEARQSRQLSRACEEQGIELSDWQEALDQADIEAREAMREAQRERESVRGGAVTQTRPGVYRWTYPAPAQEERADI